MAALIDFFQGYLHNSALHFRLASSLISLLFIAYTSSPESSFVMLSVEYH